jgi:hypothetical protein
MSRAHKGRQAGVIKITPAMIDAGVSAYDQWERDAVIEEGVSPYSKRDLVRAIFRKMLAARGRSQEAGENAPV